MPSPEDRHSVSKARRTGIISIFILLNLSILADLFFGLNGAADMVGDIFYALGAVLVGNLLVWMLAMEMTRPHDALLTQQAVTIAREKDAVHFAAAGLEQSFTKTRKIAGAATAFFGILSPFIIFCGCYGLYFIWAKEFPQTAGEMLLAFGISIFAVAAMFIFGILTVYVFWRTFRNAGTVRKMLPGVTGREWKISPEGMKIFIGVLDEDGWKFNLKRGNTYLEIPWDDLISWHTNQYDRMHYRYGYFLYIRDTRKTPHNSGRGADRRGLLIVKPQAFLKVEKQLFEEASRYAGRALPDPPIRTTH